ncbi:MAG: DUF262 domain-containing protein [Candidatus Thermoplasmatota archaeon]|jgi:hypothetical protein
MLDILKLRDSLDTEPTYQRGTDVWREEQKAFLIDSILNGFVIPPIYIHEYSVPRQRDELTFSRALIDGKQRLNAIWQFFDGEVKLAKDFIFEENKRINAVGFTYEQLGIDFPSLRAAFDRGTLPVVSIVTEDDDLIHQMFTRLNKGEKLNNAERRNAIVGPFAAASRRLAAHDFFATYFPRPNRRYSHFDLAAKFLYIESNKGPVDVKARTLDMFARSFIHPGKQDAEALRAQKLVEESHKTLKKMILSFGAKDRLLSSLGMVVVYYLLFLEVRKTGGTLPSRNALAMFERVRKLNKKLLETDPDSVSPRQAKYVTFDKYHQRNEADSFEKRLGILKTFLNEFKPSLKPEAYLK